MCRLEEQDEFETIWKEDIMAYFQTSKYLTCEPEENYEKVTLLLHWKEVKAFPQHAYGGAGGEMYSSFSFTTSAVDGSGHRHAPDAL
jgi:hypothetical protein